jgi:hypothetical protein
MLTEKRELALEKDRTISEEFAEIDWHTRNWKK